MSRPIGKRMKVSVTQADIDTAIPANSGHCMIAEAVTRAFVEKYNRKPYRVSVDLQTIRLCDKQTRQKVIFFTPVVCQRGLLQFDQGIKPTPFSFRIDACQVLELKENRGDKKQRSDKQKKQIASAQKSSASQARKRAGVVTRKLNGQGATAHIKTGGKAPPVAVLSGNRRQFGIRAAGSLDGPTA